MKKSETNTLRIEPRKVHAAAVGMAMVLIYFDYHYFVETFYWVFQPPFRIAIDTVTIVAIGLILNVVFLSEILATSRTYIVSAKGITVIFLGIIRRLYPWQRFQSINAVSYTHLDVYKRQSVHCSKSSVSVDRTRI